MYIFGWKGWKLYQITLLWDNISQNVGQFFSKLLNFITQYGLSRILPQPSNIFTHLHFAISVTFLAQMGGQDACCLFWAALQHRACGWITEWKLGIQVNFILAFRSVQLVPQNVASNTCNAFAAVYLKICFSTSFGKPAGISTEMGFNSYPNSSWKWNWFQIFLSEAH